MPCVLPVLSLKLLAFVGHGGAAKSQVRLSFLASTAGNLWGWFELPLPGFGNRLAEAADRRSGLLGDFFTGALATLLASALPPPICWWPRSRASPAGCPGPDAGCWC